jgi:hypothetical protein
VVIAAKEQHYDEHDGEHLSYWEKTTYEMLECRGCENITLRSTYIWSAEPGETITYFPPAVTRPRPQWLSQFAFFRFKPENLYSLFGEVYGALHAGSTGIAMMGARALIDMVILDKVGDHRTFKEGLDGMVAGGFISGTNRDYLLAAVDAGNAAAHRGYRPEDQDVSRVMDIVENLVETVYVLKSQAGSLLKNTPPRPPRLSPP